AMLDAITPRLQAPTELAATTRVQRNPHTQGFRVVIDYRLPLRKEAELRLVPEHEGVPIGETWLYRLTP
ncbi:MAG: glucan biosynthesis protein, partial [Pseudomonadota bacterium]